MTQIEKTNAAISQKYAAIYASQARINLILLINEGPAYAAVHMKNAAWYAAYAQKRAALFSAHARKALTA